MTRTTLLLTCLLAASACSRGGADSSGAGSGHGGKHGVSGPGGGKLEYPVDVAKLASRKMQYTVSAPGSLEAYQQVQITARVAGAVDKVTFLEGQEVKAGDTLATIESERYTIAVQSAQSAVDRANATEKAAQLALDRRKQAQIDSPGLIAGEEVETKQAALDQSKADVATAQEALHTAQLNLRDSNVRAPIAGTVQTRTVQQGQYLTAGAVLATILQRDPMILRFQVSEQDAPRLQPKMPVSLTLDDSARTFTAKITLVAGAADPTTRLVPVTAQVDATDHQYRLRPGAFCQVTVPIGDARDGIVVPSIAVSPTEKGNVVYIVDSNNIAHQHVVETGMHTADGSIELTRGVAAGDLLVVRGIEPLTEGAPVTISSTMTLEQASQPPPDAGVAPAKPVAVPQ
jgi:RND family efflux transporter MFP subunit